MSLSVFDLFATLGCQLRETWQEHSFDEERFPELAEACLVEAQIHTKVSPADILKAMRSDRRLDSLQVVSSFGDLSATLYRSERFYIEALFWTSGTTSIHQHGFSGAFQLLAGESVSGEHLFHQDHRLNGSFFVGRMELAGAVHLRRGMIRRIHSGTRFIHSVFHLALPSVTLVVRTNTDPGALPQYDYRPPYIKLSPNQVDVSLTKRIHGWTVMATCGNQAEAAVEISEDVQSLPMDQVYWIARSFPFAALGAQAASEIFGLIERRGLGGRILSSIEYEKIDVRIAQLRSRFQTEDVRLFLALLLNFRRRSVIGKYFAENLPTLGDPDRHIAKMVLELCRGGALNAPGYESLSEEQVVQYFATRKAEPALVSTWKTLLENPELHGFLE